jgi:hypothetical protein
MDDYFALAGGAVGLAEERRSTWTRRQTPGAEAHFEGDIERLKAEALGYLEATAKARTTTDSSAALRNDK